MMYAPTANGTAVERRRMQPQMTERSPKVATNSLKICSAPARTWRDAVKKGSLNITWAARRGNSPARQVHRVPFSSTCGNSKPSSPRLLTVIQGKQTVSSEDHPSDHLQHEGPQQESGLLA